MAVLRGSAVNLPSGPAGGKLRWERLARMMEPPPPALVGAVFLQSMRMTTSQRAIPAVRLQNHVGVRLAGYYAVLALLGWLLHRLVVADPSARLGIALREVIGGGDLLRPAEGLGVGAAVPSVADPWSLAAAALLATTSAFLLALPVVWLYVATRHKKGFQQSLVHTLILLPVIVAGIVVLVKNSLALAFSLAGVVAAVRFRNTLDDSKDAAYLFVATGIGLAAGVHVAVAVVLSVVFNLVVLGLWVTDFGHVPAPLEGTLAERRMQRALAHASRTGTFVARLDDEVLKALAPQQLEALAERAWRRRKRNAPDLDTQEQIAFSILLRARTRDPSTARALEPALHRHAGQWRQMGVVREEDGTHVVEYGVELNASTSREAFRQELTELGGAHGVEIELR